MDLRMRSIPKSTVYPIPVTDTRVAMKEHRVGIIMNGVTGRMGTNQHLVRSILAIREQGGVPHRRRTR